MLCNILQFPSIGECQRDCRSFTRGNGLCDCIICGRHDGAVVSLYASYQNAVYSVKFVCFPLSSGVCVDFLGFLPTVQRHERII